MLIKSKIFSKFIAVCVNNIERPVLFTERLLNLEKAAYHKTLKK